MDYVVMKSDWGDTEFCPSLSPATQRERGQRTLMGSFPLTQPLYSQLKMPLPPKLFCGEGTELEWPFRISGFRASDILLTKIALELPVTS